MTSIRDDDAMSHRTRQMTASSSMTAGIRGETRAGSGGCWCDDNENEPKRGLALIDRVSINLSSARHKKKKKERKEGRWGIGDKGDALQGKTNTQGCFVQVLRGSGVDGERGFLVIVA